MKTKLIIAFLTLLSFTDISASAQNQRGFYDENQGIRKGVASGQLTVAETARLNAQKAQLRREAIRYKTNDGRIGLIERADLRRGNRRLNKNICRQKHDRQRRY